MKRPWKGIFVLIMAGLLMGMILQVGCKSKETQEQDKRLELLAQNDWLRFEGEEKREGRYISIEYRVNYKREEVVHIFISGKYSTKEQYQSYYIYGKGDEILRIEWSCANREIEVSVPDMKSDSDLPAEAIKLLIERGTKHYFAVRKYFRVDTFEAAKKIIEEKTEQLKKNLEKTIR